MLKNEMVLAVDSIRLIADSFTSFPAFWAFNHPNQFFVHRNVLPANETHYFLACFWIDDFAAVSTLHPLTALACGVLFESSGHGLRL